MKVKGYIEVTVVTGGLETTEIRESLRVDVIDAVIDVSKLTPSDRTAFKLEGQTQALIVCKQLAGEPAEVEENYEQVMQLIKEASE